MDDGAHHGAHHDANTTRITTRITTRTRHANHDARAASTRYARGVRWRLPDWIAFSEAYGGSEPLPRTPRRFRTSVRRARFDAAAVWLGFGRVRTVTRGLARELVAPVGTPVRAERRGVVQVRASLVPGGVGLAIDHGDGSGAVWLQLARVRLSVGDAVDAGDPIGVVGASVRAHVPAPWAPPFVIVQTVVAGEAVSAEEYAWVDAIGSEGIDSASRTASASLRFDSAAVGDGIASCRDVRLRESMDALPTLDERAWALTFWRVAAPEFFVRGGRLS